MALRPGATIQRSTGSVESPSHAGHETGAVIFTKVGKLSASPAKLERDAGEAGNRLYITRVCGMVIGKPGRLAALFGAVFSIALAVFWSAYGPPRVNVRWREDVTPSMRAAVEARHGLTDPIHDGGTTWSYALADTTTGNIQVLLQDPGVEDTHYIDRNTFELARGTMPAPIFGPRWFVFWSALIAAGSVAVTV